VDTGKTITSLTGTRILLGAMGKDSSRLTLTQMQQYIIDNNLPNNCFGVDCVISINFKISPTSY
jgi:hypothetical protein